MKRILRGSALATIIVAAVWLASLAPTGHQGAYAQQMLVRVPTVTYYNGYGQGSYGGYAPFYGDTYVSVPNIGYSGYGSGPYGNYSGYGNLGYYQPYYGRTFGPPTYWVAPRTVYYRGY
jgi:hypothetical protein